MLVNAECCNSPYWRSWPTPALAQDRHGAGEALQDDQLDDDQGLTGSRYPTRPDLFFNYPTRPVPKFENDRVAGN